MEEQSKKQLNKSDITDNGEKDAFTQFLELEGEEKERAIAHLRNTIAMCEDKRQEKIKNKKEPPYIV